MMLTGAHLDMDDNKTSESPGKVEKPAKAFSCLRCFERKVKCDKCHPCANCVKSNVECNFRIPSAPRRKKKRGAEEVLLDRLKRAEDLLRSKGIDVDTKDPPSNSSPQGQSGSQSNGNDGLWPTSSSHSNAPGTTLAERGASNNLAKPSFAPGQLISDKEGRSRFIDNNLWNSVSDELKQPIAHVDGEDSDDDEYSIGDDSPILLHGLSPGTTVVTHLHPNEEIMWKLWSIYLENVNPMTKMIHYPTLQEQLKKAAKDVENIPKGLECLMFAIYVAALSSLTNDECEATFGNTKSALVSRYRMGVKHALARARFLSTGDFTVLQAYMTYLMASRDALDSRTMWTLAGVALRIAQCMGVHRDGTSLGLPPFETEMRRRVWWQITILDFRSAELTGSGRFGDFSLSDAKPPTNCNDSDLWPGMKEPPVNQERPTEMITCLLRCEFGAFWKEKLMAKSATEAFFAFKMQTSPWNQMSEERDALIDELQHRLEEKFLRYCDFSNPLQFMASIIGRSAISSMRLMSHHPRRWKNENEIPESERKLLWTLSMKLLENDNVAHSQKSIQRFMWHTNVYFQWQALVYLLGELKKHTIGDQVDTAWNLVDEVYDNHPEFVTDFKKPLHIAVGSLCLKAYNARMKAREDQSRQGKFMPTLRTPGYIEMLRQQRASPPTKRKSTSQTPSSTSTTVRSKTASDTMSPAKGSMMPNQGMPLPADMTTTTLQSPSEALATMSWEANNVPWGNQYSYEPMMAYDPNAVMGQMDMQNMDWNQWDYLIQDFEMGGVGGGKGFTTGNMFTGGQGAGIGGNT